MILKYIQSDLYRYTGKISFQLFLKNYLFNRGFNFSVWLRLASSKSFWAKFAYPVYYYKKKNMESIFILQPGSAMAYILVMADH